MRSTQHTTGVQIIYLVYGTKFKLSTIIFMGPEYNVIGMNID